MLKRRNSLVIILAMTSLAFFTSTVYAKQEINPWKPDQVIKTSQLVRILSEKSAHKPLILQVGFKFLYDNGHINNSIWAGPASQPEGIHRLKEAVKEVSKNQSIVIYCGCCPWTECPNIRPAFSTLQKLGFKNVKVLYIPQNFVHDWVQKGYPVTKGNKQ